MSAIIFDYAEIKARLAALSRPELETLIIQLEVNAKTLQENFDRISKEVDARLTAIESRQARLSERMSQAQRRKL